MTLEKSNPGPGAGAREDADAGQAGGPENTPNLTDAQPSVVAADPALIRIFTRRMRGNISLTVEKSPLSGEIFISMPPAPLGISDALLVGAGGAT
jgi:hypothetical protein